MKKKLFTKLGTYRTSTDQNNISYIHIVINSKTFCFEMDVKYTMYNVYKISLFMREFFFILSKYTAKLEKKIHHDYKKKIRIFSIR